MRSKDVAVVIPLFNGEKWIRETLQAVFSQNQSAAEIAVVDNGSTDGSSDIVKSFPKVKLFRCPIKGAPHARNFGLQNTTAPLVAFLDQDDIWHPDFLHILSRKLARNPECPVAFSDALTFRSTRKLKFAPSEEKTQSVVQNPWESFPTNRIVSPSAVLVRRSAIDSIGGWPTQFPISDIYTWLRLSAKDSFVNVKTKFVAKRFSRFSFSSILLEEQPLETYAVVHKVYREAIPYRIKYHPEEANDLACSLLVHGSLIELARALLVQDHLRFYQLTEILEERVKTLKKADYLVPLLLSEWIWYFLRQIKIDLMVSGGLLDVIRRNWSPSAPLTKNHVSNIIKDNFHGRSLFLATLYPITRPWKFHRWAWLWDVLINRLMV
jgi:glycosyltransferase involved in cell wall biosynthesis